MIRTDGFLDIHGVFHGALDIERYFHWAFPLRPDEFGPDDSSGRSSKKSVFELDIAQGKFVPRESVEIELACRAGVLDAGFDHLIQSRTLEFITLVNGDQQKAPELISLVKEAWNHMLNESAGTREFEVVFK